MKKVILLYFLLVLTFSPAVSKERIKVNALMGSEFSVEEHVSKDINFKISNELKIQDIIIPKNSNVLATAIQAQNEKRWHKAGFIILKLKNYTEENAKTPVYVEDKEIYLIARKYKSIDKKEASKLGAEIILTQAASIVGSCFIIYAPADIAYFFIKGAIQREKHPNWFKAGVFNAYDNSIFWFWLKGVPIKLSKDDEIQLKNIEKNKAEKIKLKIENKNEKLAQKAEKKLAKQTARKEKRKKSVHAKVNKDLQQ